MGSCRNSASFGHSVSRLGVELRILCTGDEDRLLQSLDLKFKESWFAARAGIRLGFESYLVATFLTRLWEAFEFPGPGIG